MACPPKKTVKRVVRATRKRGRKTVSVRAYHRSKPCR